MFCDFIWLKSPKATNPISVFFPTLYILTQTCSCKLSVLFVLLLITQLEVTDFAPFAVANELNELDLVAL